MFDAISFLDDYNIPHETEGKNCSPGYVNIQCPMCEDDSNHGGFNIQKEFYTCWKCKRYSIIYIIRELLGVGWNQAAQIYYVYNIEHHGLKERKKISTPPNKIKLPKKSQYPLPTRHRKYLEDRNFDPKKLEKEFHLHGTGTTGNYRLRIIAPVFYKKRLVSYQGRDITNQQKLRYKGCKIENEIIHHKNILYNQDNCKNRAVVVEGITDAWRLGANACATFGTGWTRLQLQEMIKTFDTLFILYDKEDEAQEKAEKLALHFSSFHRKVAEIITLDADDPASMSQDDARHLMRELGLR